MTYGIISDLPENIHQKPIYTSNTFNYLQKIRLLKHVRKFKKEIDIFHYIFTPTKENSFLIKKFLDSEKTKSIQTIATLREDLFSEEEIKKLIFGNLIITYSQYAKNKLNKLGFNNVEQIYPGIDLEQYSPAQKYIPLMQTMGITFEDFVVIYPGEFSRLGNIEKLIDKIIRYGALLKKNKIKFILAFRVKNKKDRRKKEKIKKILKNHNLNNEVIVPLTDFFTSMEKIYNLADIIIFPVENMCGKFDVPLAIIEAMACAKPVIISDLPILSELANEKNSVKIKTGDLEELFEKIIEAYNHREKYSEIGKNANSYAQDKFDIKKIAEKYNQIYKKLTLNN